MFWRRKTLAGVAILLGTTAVTAMLALATTIGDRIHKELAVYGANIVVTPAADALSVKIGGVDLRPAGTAFLHESDLEKLKGIFWANNITGVSPELSFHTDVIADGGAERSVGAVGLWFHHAFGEVETGAPQLNSAWHVSGAWPRNDGEVVLGIRLAKVLGKHAGDSLYLPRMESATGTHARVAEGPVFTVSGIVDTGSVFDDEVLFPLTTAQSVAHLADAIDRVEISARTRPEDALARQDPDTMSPATREIWYCRPYANSIAAQIQEAIPGSRAEQVRQVEQSEGTVLARISGLMWLVSGAALLAAGFAVSAAMATAVLERRGEIGLMRSLGASKASIAILFYAETALLALLGGGVGYLAGSGLAAWLGARIFADQGFGGMGTVFNPVLLPVVVGLALVVAIAGSTPSIRAALKMNPSAILREDG
jgi:putative ABC transport system permease protein